MVRSDPQTERLDPQMDEPPQLQKSSYVPDHCHPPIVYPSRPSLTEVESVCGLHTIFWLMLFPKARETSIGPIRKFLLVDPAISSFEIAMGGRKIKIYKSLKMGARNLQNDERIPNLVSEFKSDNI